MIEADGTGDRVIAAADQPDVTFGIAEHTGYAGPGGPRGYWWAPDGARLLVARVDSAGVRRWHVGDPAEPGRAPRVVRYPAAGTPNADVTLWIAGPDGSRTQARWDRDAFEYVPGAGWDAHGPFAVVQSRDQLTVRFLGIDPASGETTILSEQRDACWVPQIPGSPARTVSGMATWAVLHRPDVFHVVVAGAGVTDQRLYNAYWRERFLGHPDTFPERYEALSLVRAAPKLTRPLLLIHGLADTNVYPAHTLRLSSALLAAGRPHEVLLLPGVGHQALSGEIAEKLLWHQVRFLQRHLGADRQP